MPTADSSRLRIAPDRNRDRFAGLTFKVGAPSEVSLATDLARLVYQRDLNRSPEEGLDPKAHHLVCLNDSHQVIAAARVLGEEHRPFEIERAMDLRSLLGPDRLPAVIGRLCIHPDHRSPRESSLLLVGLLALSCMFAVKHRITDYFLYTYPALIPLYRKANFRRLGITLSHTHWGQVEIMHLDLVGPVSRSLTERTFSLSDSVTDQERSHFIL
jgi:predicted GNAT family N-acyltransferase